MIRHDWVGIRRVIPETNTKSVLSISLIALLIAPLPPIGADLQPMGRVRHERSSQRIGTNNGARKFLHYIVGFVTLPREEPVVWMASGPYFSLMASGARQRNSVPHPRKQVRVCRTLATDHGGFQARGQDLGIVMKSQP